MSSLDPTTKPFKTRSKKISASSIEPLLNIKELLVKKNTATPAPSPQSFASAATCDKLLTIVTDSRQVGPETCFLAYRGTTGDGHKYIPAAIKQGAAFLVVEDPNSLPDDCPVPWLHVKSGRAAWAWLLAEANGHPQDHLTLLGVTGTNGKSSTVWMTSGLLDQIGTPTMTIGTLGAYVYQSGNCEHIPTNHTTPDPDHLYPLLAYAVECGVQVVVMEVSSHALIQEKLVPLTYSGLAFTSFTRDHLDFHGSMDAYFDAKWQFFTELASSSARMVFSDTIAYNMESRDIAALSSDSWVYGQNASEKAKNWHARQSLTLKSASAGFAGTEIQLNHGRSTRRGHVPYFGQHAIENFCAALLLAEQAGGKAISPKFWGKLKPVPGRLETIDLTRQPTVIVDYAHTPDALEKTLSVLKPHCRAKLWVVFGCGGDRDRGKRPLMATIAERLADHIVITSDNPRHEEPEKIIADICTGLTQPQLALIEPDRERAIAQAITAAGRDDTVIIAGKGHETSQIVGAVARSFDDREIARKYLR